MFLKVLTCPEANGAIVVEWNVHDPSGQPAAAGMWDSLIRSVYWFVCRDGMLTLTRLCIQTRWR